MNVTQKAAIALTALFALSWVTAAHAADNNTEFGIEDDLTVLGTGGTEADPDLDVKGFSVFGNTKTGLNIPAAPGNIFVNGYVQVSSGLYVLGGSTFAAGGAYFTGVSSFSDVANIHIAGGGVNQVLKKVAGGGMQWANDSVGLDAASMGDPRYLQMPNAAETALVNSLLYQDTDDLGITLLGASSMTVTGKFEAKLAAKLLSTLDVTGNTAIAGTLGVTGDVALSNRLHVGTYATFVSSVTAKSDLGVGGTLGVTGAATLSSTLGVGAGAIFQSTVKSSGTFTVGEKDEANFVVNAADGNTTIAGTLGVTGDSVLGAKLHVGTYATFVSSVTAKDAMGVAGDFAVNTNKFQVTAANGNTAIAGTLGVTGAATLTDSLTVNGNTTLGNAAADWILAKSSATVDINGGAIDDTAAFSVKGTDSSGVYAAKFYSGANLAAWIRKK